MNILPVTNLVFGAKSVLKREFEKGNIPLKKDITGHRLKRGESSIDHTIPKSKGGASRLENYSLMNTAINNRRSNKPIEPYIDLLSLIEYIKVMLDVRLPDLNGVEYLRGWLRTLIRAIKEGK